MSVIGLAAIAAFKIEAAAMSNELRIKRHRALASIAKREGFESWEKLIATVGSADYVKRSIRELGLPTPQRPDGREQQESLK